MISSQVNSVSLLLLNIARQAFKDNFSTEGPQTAEEPVAAGKVPSEETTQVGNVDEAFEALTASTDKVSTDLQTLFQKIFEKAGATSPLTLKDGNVVVSKDVEIKGGVPGIKAKLILKKGTKITKNDQGYVCFEPPIEVKAPGGVIVSIQAMQHYTKTKTKKGKAEKKDKLNVIIDTDSLKGQKPGLIGNKIIQKTLDKAENDSTIEGQDMSKLLRIFKIN